MTRTYNTTLDKHNIPYEENVTYQIKYVEYDSDTYAKVSDLAEYLKAIADTEPEDVRLRLYEAVINIQSCAKFQNKS